MNRSAILNAIRAGIVDWAGQEGGSVEIARDIIHAYAILSIKPGTFRAICMWQQEQKRGEYEETGFVDETFGVVISFGASLRIDKGEALVSGQAGGRPLFDLCEELRDQIRALALDDTTEVGVNYLHTIPYPHIPNGLIMDAYIVEFSIGKLLPFPGARRNETELHYEGREGCEGAGKGTGDNCFF